MSSEIPTDDDERKQALRRQLAVQRTLIANRLAGPQVNDTFPRSMTMRLLTRRPDLAGKLGLVLLARFGGGSRLAMGVAAAGIATWLAAGRMRRARRADDHRDLPDD